MRVQFPPEARVVWTGSPPLGTSDISKAVCLGFTQGGGDDNYERMKQKVNDEMKKHFHPEFLNRIDDIIVFHQLTKYAAQEPWYDG